MTAFGVESENGWRPATLAPNDPLLNWKTVPGTDVTIQVMRGLPEVFLPAWVADWNAYIEPVRDADTASYTPTNAVNTSNHLNGTAVDIDWDSHPFQQRGSLNAAQMATLAEMETFYEGWMFWAGRWDDPVDEMHSQMGYNTWNRNTAAFDFIARKIRSDGFSTFRRGPLAGDPPAPAAPAAPAPNPSGSDDAAQVLYDAVPEFGVDDAAKMAPLIIPALALAQCSANVKRTAMWLAQIGEESGGFVYTEEIAKNGSYAPYIGRTWIQITWQSNYAKFGAWCVQQGLLDDANYFVNNPAALADPRWAGIGPAWFWLAPHDGHNLINDDADNGDVLAVTHTINGGENGLQDRINRYNQALALGDRLLLLAPVKAPAPAPAPTPATPPTFQDWMKAATDRDLLEYITAQVGPGDPTWSSVGSTLRDELWKLATPTEQKSATNKAAKKAKT